jgi:LAO/AO transport system kinase
MDPVDHNVSGNKANLPPRRRALSPDDYVSGVLAADRGVLARAITLVESTSPLHEAQAQEVLQRLLPHTGRSQRIGITGVPGVGKSTFIERFGCYLIEQGRKLAVLAIDPTSKRSGGSILGDKTRMEKLSQKPQAFIRPSPAGDNLGGVARRTRETLLLCEAAGFDTVLVETVGVGQSETTLRSMVDFFLLLLLPGAGDELQGIKKGIIEMADAVLINKADGDNRLRAEQARAEQHNALHYLPAATSGWTTEVALCSGLTGEGIPEAWQFIQRFFQQFEPAGIIAKRRHQQSLEWLSSLVQDELLRRFYHDPKVKGRLAELQQKVLRGDVTAVRAAQELLEGYRAAS